MNKITKDDFIKLIQLSEGATQFENYDPEAATIATQNIQQGNFFVEDKEGSTKIRSKQQAFSNK
jgi:hypothetical protein